MNIALYWLYVEILKYKSEIEIYNENELKFKDFSYTYSPIAWGIIYPQKGNFKI